MRKLESRRFTEDKKGSPAYVDVWIDLLNMPANGQSTSVDEMRRVIPIMAKLELARDSATGSDEVIVILLEDAEYEELKGRVSNGFYNANNREMLAMVDHVESAPEYKVPEPIAQPDKGQEASG